MFLFYFIFLSLDKSSWSLQGHFLKDLVPTLVSLEHGSSLLRNKTQYINYVFNTTHTSCSSALHWVSVIFINMLCSCCSWHSVQNNLHLKLESVLKNTDFRYFCLHFLDFVQCYIIKYEDKDYAVNKCAVYTYISTAEMSRWQQVIRSCIHMVCASVLLCIWQLKLFSSQLDCVFDFSVFYCIFIVSVSL